MTAPRKDFTLFIITILAKVISATLCRGAFAPLHQVVWLALPCRVQRFASRGHARSACRAQGLRAHGWGGSHHAQPCPEPHGFPRGAALTLMARVTTSSAPHPRRTRAPGPPTWARTTSVRWCWLKSALLCHAQVSFARAYPVVRHTTLTRALPAHIQWWLRYTQVGFASVHPPHQLLWGGA